MPPDLISQSNLTQWVSDLSTAYPTIMATEDEVPSERFTDQPPSCIAFCPANPSIFVVGTYKLEVHEESSSPEGTESQSRSGQLELYQIKKNAQSSGFGVSRCIDRYEFSDFAVLDLHFRPRDPAFFAICTSTSQMVFFRLENVQSAWEADSARPSFRKLGCCQIGEDDTVLATAFTWEPQPTTALLSFVVAFSSGEVKLFGLGEHGFQVLTETSIDPAHTLEAWTVAIADLSSRTKNERMLLTGGDDSVLAFHSIKSGTALDGATTTQMFQDRKSHSAGVTAILLILEGTHVNLGTRVFVTGSYDEHIRVFTLEDRPPYKRNIVAELSLGGGVWRLRTLLHLLCEEVGGDHVCSVLLLASCMHAGVRVVRIAQRLSKNMNQEACTWDVDVVGAFTKGHESMCYGADSIDIRRLIKCEGNRRISTYQLSSPQRSVTPEDDVDPPRDFVVVSTSFYDRKICVWSFRYEGTAIKKASTKLGSVDAD